jgi:hypothetical protein
MRDETPDEGLVARHRREIFPLLHQRWRFAGASGFRLLTARDGDVQVYDVFAYANDAESAPRDADERRSLVVFLNRYPRAEVRIQGVAAALGLDGGPDAFVILHDHRSGLDYLRELADLRARGLQLALDGYRCLVFVAFEVVAGPGWRELAWRIGLEGVPDAKTARRRLVDEPVREAVAALVGDPMVDASIAPEWVVPASEPSDHSADAKGLESALERLAVARGSAVDARPVATSLADALERLRAGRPGLLSAAVASWLVADAVGRIASEGDDARTLEAFDAWDVGAALGARARELGHPDGVAWRVIELARAMLAIAPGEVVRGADDDAILAHWLEDAGVRAATGWNEWQGRHYVRREAWDQLLDAVVARDRLLTAATDEVIRAAARRLEGRMAAAGYEIPAVLPGDEPVTPTSGGSPAMPETAPTG